jgi:hypothetical protein
MTGHMIGRPARAAGAGASARWLANHNGGAAR